MAENLGNENMTTRAAALGYQHDADLLRAWVSERMQMQTGEQLVSLLEATADPSTHTLRQAVRSTVEQQSISVGNQRFDVRAVALPVTISSSELIAPDALRIDHLVTPIQKTLVEAGVVPTKGGGITLLTRLVSHGQVRALSYAQMFELSRQIFHSAIVASGTRQRIDALRNTAGQDVQSIGGRHIFSGYILGCIYSRHGSKFRSEPRPTRVPGLVGPMLLASLASMWGAVEVRAGRLASIYDAIDQGASNRVQTVVNAVVEAVPEECTHISTAFEADPEDCCSTVLRVKFHGVDAAEPETQLAFVFNTVEQEALARVLEHLSAHTYCAHLHDACAAAH